MGVEWHDNRLKVISEWLYENKARGWASGLGWIDEELGRLRAENRRLLQVIRDHEEKALTHGHPTN